MNRWHYGWTMVACAVGILSMHALTFYSFGIFLRPITEQFNWDRGALSAALSIGMLVSGPMSILTGRLSDRYGPRPLVAVSGVLTGVSFAMMSQVSALWHAYLIYGVALAVSGSGCVVPLSSTIPRWFDRRRGVALGLTWTGIGLGGIIAPLLSQWLITDYGWRMAYVVLGAVNIVFVTSLAMKLRQAPERIGLKPYGYVPGPPGLPDAVPTGMTARQALRTPRFWGFGLVMFGFIFTHQIMMAHLAPHARDVGVPATLAASIVSIFAATSLIGRNVAGLWSDRVGPTKTIAVCLVVVAVTVAWLLPTREVWMFVLFAVFYGVAYGGVIPLQTLVISDMFGLKHLGAIMATLMLLGSIGGALGAPLAGAIFDTTGSYQSAFGICLALLVLAIILSVWLMRTQRRSTGRPLEGGT